MTYFACTQGEAGQKIADDVRKYRQSIFKLNHKIKKSRAAAMSSATTQPDADSAEALVMASPAVK